MNKNIITYIALGLLVSGVTSQSASAAGIIEKSCVCQGYGTSGDNIPVGDTTADNLAQARKEAIEDCRAGTYYRGAGNVCTLPACPAGTIDITPVDGNGRSQLVNLSNDDGGDITRTFDQYRDGSTVVEVHNPSASACQRMASGRYQCSVTGQVKRQCAF